MKRINKWLAQLRIAHKLFLSGIVFALPIAILLYFVTTQYGRGIETSQREVEGTTLLGVCRGLQHDLRVVETRASLAAEGAAGSPEGLAETRQGVSHAITTLEQNEDSLTKSTIDRLSDLWRQHQASGDDEAG